MPNRDELLSLAVRCEAAEGPDRELADAIMIATGWTIEDHGGLIVDWWSPKLKRFPAPRRPNPTASLDAAKSLAADTAFELAYSPDQTRQHAAVWANEKFHRGSAATPALALVAASLRALASKEPE